MHPRTGASENACDPFEYRATTDGWPRTRSTTWSLYRRRAVCVESPTGEETISLGYLHTESARVSKSTWHG